MKLKFNIKKFVYILILFTESNTYAIENKDNEYERTHNAQDNKDNNNVDKKKKKKKEYEKIDKKYSWKPSALTLGIDVFTPIFYYFYDGKDIHYYNIEVCTDINRVNIDLFGSFMKINKINRAFQKNSKETSYHNKEQFSNKMTGYHFKAGMSYNFMTKKQDHDCCFLGVGYNQTIMLDHIQGNIYNDTSYDKKEINKKGIFHYIWMSLYFGLRVTIASNIFIGSTIDINILKKMINDNKKHFLPYMIPGWGKEVNTVEINYHIYLGYNIPLFSDPIFEEKE